MSPCPAVGVHAGIEQTAYCVGSRSCCASLSLLSRGQSFSSEGTALSLPLFSWPLTLWVPASATSTFLEQNPYNLLRRRQPETLQLLPLPLYIRKGAYRSYGFFPVTDLSVLRFRYDTIRLRPTERSPGQLLLPSEYGRSRCWRRNRNKHVDSQETGFRGGAATHRARPREAHPAR